MQPCAESAHWSLSMPTSDPLQGRSTCGCYLTVYMHTCLEVMYPWLQSLVESHLALHSSEASSSTQFESSDALNTQSEDSHIIPAPSSLPLSSYLLIIIHVYYTHFWFSIRLVYRHESFRKGIHKSVP